MPNHAKGFGFKLDIFADFSIAKYVLQYVYRVFPEASCHALENFLIYFSRIYLASLLLVSVIVVICELPHFLGMHLYCILDMCSVFQSDI